MKDTVGGYELRKLWEELQQYKPGENGSIIFNFERFKRVHDITPDAELIDFKESGEGMKPISEEEAKMLYAFRMVWKAEKEKTERPIHDQLVSNG
jgi:hypothetical protein